MRVYPTPQEIESAIKMKELQRKICNRSCSQSLDTAIKNFDTHYYATTVNDGTAWAIACERTW